ncbi:MAG TPA: hypothetical protein VGJ75_20885 [Dongiaceae bacterium]|jgi:hypothetical protein
MLDLLARILKPVVRRAARSAPGEPSNPDSAIDSLPPVIGPDDWRHVTLIDRSMAWYFDRR